MLKNIQLLQEIKVMNPSDSHSPLKKKGQTIYNNNFKKYLVQQMRWSVMSLGQSGGQLGHGHRLRGGEGQGGGQG